jgi:hypothetical protein
MAFSPIERLILLFEADPLESFRRNGRTVVQVDSQQLDLSPAVTSFYFRELTVPDEAALPIPTVMLSQMLSCYRCACLLSSIQQVNNRHRVGISSIAFVWAQVNVCSQAII